MCDKRSIRSTADPLEREPLYPEEVVRESKDKKRRHTDAGDQFIRENFR